MKNTVKITLALLGLASIALSSCNTVAGIGQDLQSAGGTITEGARQ